MAQRTLNGWKVREHPGTGTFVAPNGKTVYCADDDVAEVFRYIVEQWHQRIEPLPEATYNTYPNERRGYIVVHCSRPVPLNGLKNSNHLSHTAIDVLGDKHHYERSCSLANGSKGCWGDKKPHPYISGFSAAQITQLRAIAAEVDQAAGKQIIRLGIDFAPGWRDAMHVELAPGTTNADVARAAMALRALRIVEDLTHQHTMLLALGYTADVTGVRAYQTDRGLAVDGKPGPITTAALEADMSTIKDVLAAQEQTLARIESINNLTWGYRNPGWSPNRDTHGLLRDAATAVTNAATLARIEAALAEQNGHEVDVDRLASLLAPLIGEIITETDATVTAEAVVDLLAQRLGGAA